MNGCEIGDQNRIACGAYKTLDLCEAESKLHSRFANRKEQIVSVNPTPSSGSSGNQFFAKEQALMQEQEAMYYQNFVLQTKQAENDNQNSTTSAIEASHAQTWSSATAAQRQVGESNAHISA